MAPPRVPDDVTDLDDPTVDVIGMVAEAGAASVARVQAPPLSTRAQLRAARVELQDGDAAGVEMHNLLLQPQLSGVSEYEPGSNSDGACVGAPTCAHPRNDQPAATFDINAFAQALSHSTSQHVPAATATGGKAAAMAKSDKPK